MLVYKICTKRRCGISKLLKRKAGSPAWIRTTIHGSKGRCHTIRRPGNTLGENYFSVSGGAAASSKKGDQTRFPDPDSVRPGIDCHLASRRAVPDPPEPQNRTGV